MVCKAKVASEGTGRMAAPATVVIFDGDPIVGRALKLLLRTADYSVKYVARDPLERLGTLEGVRVLLLGPGWDIQSREAVVEAVGDAPDPSRISVLELGFPPEGAGLEPERYVPWPCRAEDLKRWVDAALLDESKATDGAERRGLRRD